MQEYIIVSDSNRQLPGVCCPSKDPERQGESPPPTFLFHPDHGALPSVNIGEWTNSALGRTDFRNFFSENLVGPVQYLNTTMRMPAI